MSTRLLIQATDELVRALRPLQFSLPITHVYNPLIYAAAPHRQYVSRYAKARGALLLLGMNPGPWGMAQTGVPFGVVSLVRHWLKINAKVGRPVLVHPRRPVQGFQCGREEVSGVRLWGWARETFTTPRRFFQRFFVANYCPLMFLEATGRNRTPDRIPAAEREPLLNACDQALRRMVECLRPRLVVGVGAFAEKRARRALEGASVPVAGILHPSPASPRANRGWGPLATAQLAALGAWD